MDTTMKLICIAVGGAAGSLARYGLSGLVQSLTGSLFPWGTMAVNLLGCFIVGMLWPVVETRIVPDLFRPAVIVGFLGGFTTFSAFGMETTKLLTDKEIGAAMWNIFLNTFIGVALVFAGMLLMRHILAGRG